jgi:hypothetical protein
MTNYNDGQIHGWNGGDRPVHPETLVDAWFDNGIAYGPAGAIDWSSPLHCSAFRVVKEYREPREFWITLDDGMAWDAMAQAEKHNAVSLNGGSAIIHVREVLK